MARQTAPLASTRAGMGAIPFEGGVTFRVWAPHADSVSVAGSFNGWDVNRDAMAAEDGGTWSVDVVGAADGDEYRFLVRAGGRELWRIDPRARRLTSSVGNAIVYDAGGFDWGDTEFRTPDWNDLVIYELHVGTFTAGMHGRPGTLDGVRRRLEYLRDLGVGAIQLMPPFEFAGERSWGYNPAHPFAVETTYGQPDDLKGLVNAAHRTGHRRVARRRLQPPRPVGSRPLAVRWLVRERQGWDLLLPGRPVVDAVGRDPTRLRPVRGPRLPPRQRRPVAGRVPGRRAALGRDLVHLEHRGRRLPRSRPDRGRLAFHGRRQRGVRRALSDPPDDRRRHAGGPGCHAEPTRQGARASGPSGTAASSTPCAPRSSRARTRIATWPPSRVR